MSPIDSNVNVVGWKKTDITQPLNAFKFWFGAHKGPDENYESDPEDLQKHELMYSTNTMKNFCYSLNWILRSKSHNYDIIKPSTLSFQHSQKAFAVSQKELKELGKAKACLHCVLHSCFEMENALKNAKSCFTKNSTQRSKFSKSKMTYQSSCNSLIFWYSVHQRCSFILEKFGCKCFVILHSKIKSLATNKEEGHWLAPWDHLTC